MSTYLLYLSDYQLDRGMKDLYLFGEAILKKKLSFLLDNDSSILENESLPESKRQAYYDYFTYGIDSDEFQKSKTEILGEVDFKLFTGLIDRNSIGFVVRTENGYDEFLEPMYDKIVLEVDTYYEIETIYDKKAKFCGYFTDPFSLDTDPERKLKFSIKKIDQKLLESLFSLKPNYVPNDYVPGIDEDTKISDVCILNVGAALCCTIYEDKGNLIAIYDLGVSRKHLLIPQKTTCAVGKNLAQLTMELMRSTKKKIPISVFISHWHEDHTNYILPLYTDLSRRYLKNLHFYVPATKNFSNQSIALRIKLVNASSKMTVMPNPPLGKQSRREFGDNENFILGNINCSSHTHPHHHGMFLEIKIGKIKILLAGDCTYAGIWEQTPHSYNYVQMSHHGGCYGVTSMNSCFKKQYLPIPLPSGEVKNGAIASADGISYGHPNRHVIRDMKGKGWNCHSTSEKDIRYFQITEQGLKPEEDKVTNNDPFRNI